ncbi:MFS transporter [Candidatus Saccharibacteria bacterium]|nr:MFS transporter [Candidatus Saccharibacteria bacterium]
MYKSVLTNRNFLKNWLAQLFSQLAANLLNFALIIRVFELSANTEYANIAVSLLILSFAIPAVVFAVLAGAYVDYLDRKKVLVITNVARAILVLGFLLFESNLILVYLLVFAISIFSQFFTPAEAAALPKLVNKKQLVVANSLFLFTLYSSFILGYSLAGPIISTWGTNSVYWVTAVAFAISALLSLGLPKLQASQKGLNIRNINRDVFVMIRQTTTKIIKTPALLIPIVNLTIGQMIICIIAVVAPGLAILLFGQSLASVSYKLILPVALGLIIGSVLVGQLLRNVRKVQLINFGILIATVSLLGIGIAKNFSSLATYTYIVVILAFGLGLANAMVGVSAQTLLQVHSSDDERGKIFGTLNMMMNLAATLPVLLAGITADLISPASVMIIAGGLVGAYGIYQFIMLKKHKLLGS